MRSKLLIIPVLIALLPPSQAATLIVSSRGGDYLNIQADYLSIQDAIDNATSGDIILVDNGTYRENLNVNKTLTLRGMRSPVVSGSFSGSVITINADGVVLEGFLVTESGRCESNVDPEISRAGILVNSKDNTIRFDHVYSNYCGILFNNSSSNNSIDHNEVRTNDKYGIYLLNSSKNNVTNNTVNKSNHGIYLLKSSNNNISNNDVFNCEYGIYLLNSSRNIIYDNYAGLNGNAGICLEGSTDNNLSENNASDNKISEISLNESHKNVISGNHIIENPNHGPAWGILLKNNCINNTISYNSIQKNENYGIRFEKYCKHNTIIGNEIIDLEISGIFICSDDNNYNVIKNNTIRKCGSSCISIMNGSTRNDIYGNNFNATFINTLHIAVDSSGTNFWDNGRYGNFYSDCDPTDSNDDGICDSYYKIYGGVCGVVAVDRYPLANEVKATGF